MGQAWPLPTTGDISSLPFLQSQIVDLTGAGKGLKVQTEKPHLVSLGSGRLSTAITLLPLEEGKWEGRGRALAGSSRPPEPPAVLRSPSPSRPCPHRLSFCRPDSAGLSCRGHCPAGGGAGPPSLLH